ncbi:hypothetical protein ACIQVO_30370 [Streptomyces sp. NPDC101062]|uniref:hypothetical protein n=1 Tax=Streptomyces sp. NPDC101062 TaxID=3366103 RepID=UPI0038302B06
MHGTHDTAAEGPGPGDGSRPADGSRPGGGGPDGAEVADVALGLPDTAEALAHYRTRAGTWARGGAALLAGAAVIALAARGRGLTWPEELLPSLCGLALFALGLGLGARRLARRMRDRLAQAPWRACAAVSVPRGLRGGTVVLRDPVTGDLWPLAVVAVQQRYQLVEPGPGGVLWWCGDPRTGGVIAPPGGAELVWTRAVRGERARQRNVREAVGRGLLERPAPRQPQPQPQPQATAASASATTSASTSASASASTSASVMATSGTSASHLTPASSLTDSAVLSPTPAVSARRPVSLAKATDRPARTDRHAPLTFTYAVLAAEAHRAHAPRTERHRYRRRYRPDLDIRAVPWWRVRTLRELSSLTAVFQSLGVAAGIGVVWLIPGDETPWLTLLMGGICTATGLTALGRLIRRGVPTVRTLVRAALAPVPVPKRYVLLNDPYGAGPVLLFFPAHGRDDDLPEALLGVLPPGTGRRPWLGMPAPTGEVELRGWLDPSPAVVPWIEGRALWPRHPYEEINPNDAGTRAYLELLAPNVTPR